MAQKIDEMLRRIDNTPSGNTGCVDTLENGLRALVDWVSVSFSDVKTLTDLAGLLQMPEQAFEVRDVGYRGYTSSATYGHITLAWGSPKNAENMGGFIEMSGQGCREYENHFDLNLDWSHFFALVMNFNHKFSRLDLAIDDFKGYFTIEQAYRCAKKGCLVAQRVKKARSYEEFFLDDGKTHGRTLYIGKADWQITLYDKVAERDNANADVLDYVKFWNRYELRLRNKIATDAAHVLAFESYTVGEFVKGFMAAKIDFKVNNLTDSNKSRWKSQRWWTKFLNNAEKIALSQVAPDPTIERIGSWLERQVDTSLSTYIEAFDNDRVVIEYFKLKGAEKKKKKHEQMIEQFNKNPELKQRMFDEMVEYVEEKRDENNAMAQYLSIMQEIETHFEENNTDLDKYLLVRLRELNEKKAFLSAPHAKKSTHEIL